MWVGGDVVRVVEGEGVEVQCEGEDVTRLVEAKSHDSLPLLRNPQMLVGANDLTTLSYLHEPAGTVYVCVCVRCVCLIHVSICVSVFCAHVCARVYFVHSQLSHSASISFLYTYSPFSPPPPLPLPPPPSPPPPPPPLPTQCSTTSQ